MALEFDLRFGLIGLSFLITLVMTRVAISRLWKLGMVAEDFHKKNKPRVPSIGGVSIVAGFGLSLLIAYFLYNSIVFLVVLTAFLISASIGLIDDLYALGPRQKLIVAAFGGIPLLLLVPLEVASILLLFGAVIVVSNWTNMLAGLNGLETGLGFIATLFLALVTPNQQVSFILFAYSASLLAFLLFNKYPARIFPGDVGTFPIGVVLVSAFVLGAPFWALAVLLLPHFLDACLKFFSVGFMSRAEYKPTPVNMGVFAPSKKSYLSLPRLIMRIKPMREWQVVGIIWGIELILGLMVVFA